MEMRIDEIIQGIEIIKAQAEWDYPLDWQIVLDGAIDIMRKYQKLEQEPTTKNDLGVDAISRDEVCRYVAEFVNHEFSTREEEELIDNIITGIEHMPSVTPQERKTGHWVNDEYCSECGCDVPACIVDWKWQKDMDAKYCPNCGCRMVESQESEDT